MERRADDLRDKAKGVLMLWFLGRPVEVLERHVRADGVVMVLVSWRDAYMGQVTQWVRADEVGR